MLDIMESIRHSTLKSCASVLETKREFPIGKSTPRKNKSGFMSVLRSDVNLIIAGETIHEREDFTSDAIIDNLIDERGRKVVFWTSFIDIPIINAYRNGDLFLVNWGK